MSSERKTGSSSQAPEVLPLLLPPLLLLLLPRIVPFKEAEPIAEKPTPLKVTAASANPAALSPLWLLLLLPLLLVLVDPPSRRSPAHTTCVTVISLQVKVPVLSTQMVVAQPSASTAGSFFTTLQERNST